MSLRIPNGFRLKISKNDYDSFKKEIKEYLYPFLLKELSTELYKKCFDDFYVAKEEVDIESLIKDIYKDTCRRLPAIIEKGIRDFSAIDVLCKIIYLEKEDVIYGLIDCDVLEVRDLFLNHPLVEHYSPNYFDTKEEELERVTLWESLLPSLIEKKNCFIEEDWIVQYYPRINEVLLYIKEYVCQNQRLRDNLLIYYILDKVCIEKEIKSYSTVTDILQEIKASYSEGNLNSHYEKHFNNFYRYYVIYNQFYQNY